MLKYKRSNPQADDNLLLAIKIYLGSQKMRLVLHDAFHSHTNFQILFQVFVCVQEMFSVQVQNPPVNTPASLMRLKRYYHGRSFADQRRSTNVRPVAECSLGTMHCSATLWFTLEKDLSNASYVEEDSPRVETSKHTWKFTEVRGNSCWPPGREIISAFSLWCLQRLKSKWTFELISNVF